MTKLQALRSQLRVLERRYDELVQIAKLSYPAQSNEIQNEANANEAIIRSSPTVQRAVQLYKIVIEVLRKKYPQKSQLAGKGLHKNRLCRF